MIVQTGPRTYQLRARSTGKVLGTHPSYDAALRQERAIYASKARRAAGLRRNPTARRMYAGELRVGDTIEMEDLGREHVIQGPYRSARGIRFVDQHGVSLILQPNEIVRLVERENPTGDKETMESLITALHEYNSSFRKEQLARSLQHEIDTNPNFTKKDLTGPWGPMWPRLQAFVEREQKKAKRENPTSVLRGPRGAVLPESTTHVTYTDNDNEHRWIGWMRETDKEFAMLREYRVSKKHPRRPENAFRTSVKWDPVKPMERYHFDVRDGELVMPGYGNPPFSIAMLAQEMYARLKRRASHA